RIQVGALGEDPFVQLAELGRGIDPELVGEDLAGPLVGAKRLALSPGAVQGEHQLFPEAFTERMTRRESLELADGLSEFPDRELRVDPFLQCREAQVIEPCRLRSERRLGREIAEGGTPPQIERVVECTDRRLRVDRQESPGVAQEGLETNGIELRRLGPQDVTCPAPLDPLWPQGPAQMRGVALEGVPNGLPGLLTPHLVDEYVGRYEVVGAKKQVGQDRPLLGPPERDRGATVLDDLDRAKDPELHRSTVVPGRRDGNAGCRRRSVAHEGSVGGVAERSLKGTGQSLTCLPHWAFRYPVRPCAHAR